MKKLIFMSFAVLGLGVFPEEAWSLPPNPTDPGSSQSNPNFVPLSEEQFNEYMRNQERHVDDIRNLMEMFNNQISNMNSQMAGLTQQVQGLNEKVLSLTNENETLKSEKGSLQRQIDDMHNSIEQQRLNELKRANDLKEQEQALLVKIEKDKAKAEASHRSQINEKRSQIMNQIKKLNDERAMAQSFVSGTRPRPSKMAGQRTWDEWKREKREAPDKIKRIDSELRSLEAQLSSLH